MKQFFFGLLILGFSSVSSAALMDLTGDGTWGTLDGPYEYCTTEAICLSSAPATTSDLLTPINDAYPTYDLGWYLTDPQFDAEANMYFQPDFGMGSGYQSLINGFFLVKTVWRGLEGVAQGQENSVFTINELIFLNIGDQFWLDTFGTAINSNAFVFMSVKHLSEVPLPASFFLFAPALLGFMRWRTKYLNS